MTTHGRVVRLLENLSQWERKWVQSSWKQYGGCSKSKLKHHWMQIHHTYSCVRLRTLSHHTVRIPAHPWLKPHSSEQWRPRASLSVYLQLNVMAFGSWTWSSGAYLSRWTWPTGSPGVCQSLPVTRHTCITHTGARLPLPRRLFPI